MAGADVVHAVVRDARQLRRLRGAGHELDRRHRQREDLLVVAELLHHAEPRVQVEEHRDRGPAPHRRLVGNDLDHLVEIGFGEDVGKDVELPHGVSLCLGACGYVTGAAAKSNAASEPDRLGWNRIAISSRGVNPARDK